MKKLYLCCLLLLSASFPALAQEAPKSGGVILSVDAGYAMPLDKYSSTDTVGSSSGFANGGFVVQFAVDWIGKHCVGLGLAYAIQYNPLDKSAKNFTPSGQEYELGTKPWINNYILAGPSYTQTFGKITVNFAARIGGMLSSSSNFNVTIPDMDTLGTGSPTVSEGMGLGVAYQIRGGVGYDVTKKISLFLHLDYMGGSPSRTKTYYYYITEIDPVLGPIQIYQQAEIKIKKTVSTFDPSLGIIIKL